ncbi:MAG: LacI family DNA-binding transcriptional regulator [Opitutaceae bacterium]|nr:LacI family DNA-binding transcriptional regulator [Opitutaceae bacterium]
MPHPSQSPANGGHRPTLRDLARASGFHATTISKALRGHPSIPAETRERIAKLAETMGYERNPVYLALSRFRRDSERSTRTPRIAFIENIAGGAEADRPPQRKAMLEGASSQARLLGYDLEVLSVGEDHHDARSLTQHLQNDGITGIILASFVPGFSEIALNWDVYAVAKIHSRHMEPDATVVGNDQLREVRLAIRNLDRLGYRRIGMAVGRADEDACAHRHTAGFLMEVSAFPEERRIPPLLYPYNMRCEDLAVLLGRWVRRHKLDAVLCNLTQIQSILEQAGFRVPTDIACATLSACDPAAHSHLAGTWPQYRIVGERAVSIVVTQLKAGEPGLPEFPSATSVQSIWRDGPSAPPRHG